MNHHRPFLDDIRTDPEEDAPRLIYADYLEETGEPDRAEFIRLQIREAKESLSSQDYDRMERLVKTHWQEWVGPLRPFLPVTSDWESEYYIRGKFDRRWRNCFHRGFITRLTVTSAMFCEHGDELFDIAPIHALRLQGAYSHPSRLAQCPSLAGVDTLSFPRASQGPIDSDTLGPLAESPYLIHLKHLYLNRHNVGDEGLRLLASAHWFNGLQTLHLGDTGLSDAGLQVLRECCDFRPRSLDLSRNYLSNDSVGDLAQSGLLAQTHELFLGRSELTAHIIRSLMPTNLGALRRLYLDHTPFNVSCFIGMLLSSWFPRLQTLDLSNCNIHDDAVEQLLGYAAHWLLSLRRFIARNNFISPTVSAQLQQEFSRRGIEVEL